MCYLNRTYHVLLTGKIGRLDNIANLLYADLAWKRLTAIRRIQGGFRTSSIDLRFCFSLNTASRIAGCETASHGPKASEDNADPSYEEKHT